MSQCPDVGLTLLRGSSMPTILFNQTNIHRSFFRNLCVGLHKWHLSMRLTEERERKRNNFNLKIYHQKIKETQDKKKCPSILPVDKQTKAMARKIKLLFSCTPKIISTFSPLPLHDCRYTEGYPHKKLI